MRKQYHYATSAYVFYGCLLLFASTIYGILFHKKFFNIIIDLFCNKNYINTVFLICLLLLVLSGVSLLFYANTRKAFAVIDKRGITVYKKPAQHLATISWCNICKCVYLPRHSRSDPPYMLVTVSYTAPLNDRPAFMQEKSITKREAKENLLDNLMEKLARGQITVSQFNDVGAYLLVLSEKEYKAFFKLWKAGNLGT